MQDEVALALATRLTLSESQNSAGGATWVCDVWPPPDVTDPTAYSQTVTRVHRQSDDAADPTDDVYDVVEAYWSPIDKGKTTALRVIAWLLRTVFAPLNTTARYVAAWNKQLFDILYVGIAIGLAVFAFLAGAFLTYLGLFRLVALVGSEPSKFGLQTFLELIGQPWLLGSMLVPSAIALLIAGFVGGFLVTQAFKGALAVNRNWTALGAFPAQRTSRVLAITWLLVFGLALVACVVVIRVNGVSLHWWGLTFLGAAGFFELLLSLMRNFILQFFGDVQIYCTHDENSEFYALRESILGLVAKTIYGTCSAEDAAPTAEDAAATKPRYDRVVVLAHSLGSTIAMDALIRLYNAQLSDEKFARSFSSIRAFVSFGTALEKTKYFFDAYNPTLSQSFDEWRNDSYGVIFSEDPRVLLGADNAAGIFWANYWYLEDPVCNKIETYLSYLVPGDSIEHANAIRDQVRRDAPVKPGEAITGHAICRNEQGTVRMALTPSRICIHGAYIGDPWFWNSDWSWANPSDGHLGVLTIVQARTPSPDPSFRAPDPSAVPVSARYAVKKAIDAAQIRDQYSPTDRAKSRP